MDTLTSGAVTVERLRERLYEDSIVTPQRFLAQVEVDADKIYTVALPEGTVRFRRWNHEEASRLFYLPFIRKLLTKDPLSEEEITQFSAFETEMVSEAILDAGKWASKLGDEKFVSTLYLIIATMSGMDEEFDTNLSKFMDSEFGFAYGWLWFQIFGKTPSEIAKLPETDVKTINRWIMNYAERMKTGVKPISGLP